MEKDMFIRQLISTLESTYNKDEDTLNKFKKLIVDCPTTFFGKKADKHITASALVVNKDYSKVLLTHHKKLNDWLQLGGHWCDFEVFPTKTLLDAACKEVEEEAFDDKPINQEILLESSPLDLDVHLAKDHYHYDVSFLVMVSEKNKVHVSTESYDVKWILIDEIISEKKKYNERLVRMCISVRNLINGRI